MATRFDMPPSFDLALTSTAVPSDEHTELMLEIINALWMKNRSLVTDGFDESLDYIGNVIPLTVHEIPSGTEAWSWIVPKKWVVRAAWLKHRDRVICDFKDHPLHLVSYSHPYSGELDKQELDKHLYFNADRPDAIPYVYTYYKAGWGFCIPYNVYKSLPDGRYQVHIDTSLDDGVLKVGEAVLKGSTDESVIISAHLCHPGQANDGLSGVALGISLFKRLSAISNRRYTYRLVLVPENIGSLCYLFKQQHLLRHFKHAIFLEMVGNKNHIKLQKSRQGDAVIDQLAEYAIKNRVRTYGTGPFRKIVCNDEINFNGPGIDIPTVSLSRWHYPEYHTSDDNPSIISRAYLKESFDLVWDVVGLLERNIYPRRKYTGNLFLSRYGLYEDLNVDDTIEQILLSFDGKHSVFQIAQNLSLPFDRVWSYVQKFYEAGVISIEHESSPA